MPGDDEKCMKCVVGKPKGERSFGRYRRRREDNTKTALKEIGCEDLHWI
jgi:hypothetical protein